MPRAARRSSRRGDGGRMARCIDARRDVVRSPARSARRCRPRVRGGRRRRRSPLVGVGRPATPSTRPRSTRCARRSPTVPADAPGRGRRGGEGRRADARARRAVRHRRRGRRSTSPSTRSTARGSPRPDRPGAMAILAVAPRGAFLDLGPAHYLDKLVHAGPDAGLELGAPVAEQPRPPRRRTRRAASPSCGSPCRRGRGTRGSPPRCERAGAPTARVRARRHRARRARRGIRRLARPAARHRRRTRGGARGGHRARPRRRDAGAVRAAVAPREARAPRETPASTRPRVRPRRALRRPGVRRDGAGDPECALGPASAALVEVVGGPVAEALPGAGSRRRSRRSVAGALRSADSFSAGSPESRHGDDGGCLGLERGRHPARATAPIAGADDTASGRTLDGEHRYGNPVPAPRPQHRARAGAGDRGGRHPLLPRGSAAATSSPPTGPRSTRCAPSSAR